MSDDKLQMSCEAQKVFMYIVLYKYDVLNFNLSEPEVETSGMQGSFYAANWLILANLNDNNIKCNI